MRDSVYVQPDGTHIVVRVRSEGKKIGVLLLPDLGDTILDPMLDKIADELADEETTIYIPELRGHPASHGSWSLHLYRTDLAYWMNKYAAEHDEFYVVALGLSASTMLEYEDQAHYFRGTLPPLPDGMLLLAPVFHGEDVLPLLSTRSHMARKVFPSLSEVLLRKRLPERLRRCSFVHLPTFWREIITYALPPVRAQTPTIVLVPTDENSDPLKRLFGSIRVRRVPWLHHLRATTISQAELLHHLSTVRKEFKHLREQDKPHRFRIKKARPVR